MTVVRKLSAGAAAAALLALSIPASAADSPAKLCPSDTDIPYSVKMDDTLWTITARAYCLNDWPPLYYGWKTLAEYNKGEVGPNPDRIYSGAVICLPERIDRGKWHANRCAGADGAAAPAAGAGTCGNGRREGQEICDGGDIGGLTCEMLDRPPGRLACRSDCKGFETQACGAGDPAPASAQSAPGQLTLAPGQCVQCCSCMGGRGGQDGDGDRAPKKPKKPLVIKVAAEITGGVALPLTRELHEYIYRLVGVVGAGARVTIDWAEIAPRVFFLYGAHGTNFNDIEQQQSIIGLGALVQGGVPFSFGAFQLTPGVEAGWMYVNREIELMDYPFAGQIEEQSGHLPLAGVFLRPAYHLGPKQRVSLALDLSIDLVLTRLGDNAISSNFNTKLLGGVGYAF
jgi:hypothetical protein